MVEEALHMEGAEGDEGVPPALRGPNLCPQRRTRETAVSQTRRKLPRPSLTGQSPLRALTPQAGVESLFHNVGRRLSSFTPAWKSITTDQFILNVIQNGYALVFDDE